MKLKISIWIFVFFLSIMPMAYAAADQCKAGSRDITECFSLANSVITNGNATDADVGAYYEINTSDGGGAGGSLQKTVAGQADSSMSFVAKILKTDNLDNGDIGVHVWEIPSSDQGGIGIILNLRVNQTFFSDFSTRDASSVVADDFSATWHRFDIIYDSAQNRQFLYVDCFIKANSSTQHIGARNLYNYGRDNGYDADDVAQMRFTYVNYSQTIEYPPNIGTNCSPMPAASAASAPNITITAADSYDSVSLTNFSVLFRASANQTFSTVNGTIPITNITNGLYNITFMSGANGSYFNSTYLNINVSGQNFQGNLTQSYVNLYVNDTISSQLIQSFTVKTNYSTFNVSNGYILLASKSGRQGLNISATQYPATTYTYSITALENITFIANLSSIFNFYLKREADNSIFNVLGTNTTKLTIYCPNKSIVLNFKNQTYNSTQENATVDCAYTLMKMDVVYPDSTYFRTLVPATTQKNVTWWLLDLNLDTGIQKILELVDLTGEWSQGKLRLMRPIGNTNEKIIEQFFDVSTAVTLYLLKDAIYTVVLINNAGTEERQLGTLIADTAGTVTITYPNIPFYPQQTYLEDNISWSYTCPFAQCPYPYNTSSMILRFQYNDVTGQTSSITWKIYNGSNTSNLYQTFTSTSSNVSFTYQPVAYNRTYYTTLFIQHDLLSFNITEYKSFGDFQAEALSGFSEEEQTNIYQYGSGIFLVVWGMLFSAYHAGIGLLSTFGWALILKYKGYFTINYLQLSLFGIAAISGFVYEAMKKE